MPDLDKARALLSRARQDIEPRQWEQLDRKLAAAERAFERFSRAAKASGHAAKVVRGSEGVAQAGRVRTLAEFLPGVGPLLVGLVLLYPSSTAGPDIDRRPEWVDAQGEYEARLREVAEESRRLMEEFERQEAEEVVPDFDSAPLMAVREPKTWRTTVNPATGKFYTTVEEYDRVPRHEGQICKNSKLDELEEEKRVLYTKIPILDPRHPNSSNERWEPEIPCSNIRNRLKAMQKVLDKREEIKKKCFGGKSDAGHDKAIGDLQKSIAYLKRLEGTNCVSGHPMADRQIMSKDLFAAIKQHDTARVKALLEGGANPNEPQSEGRGVRPLQEAIFALCDGGEVDMLKVLIEHGADVNAWDVERDQTPLLTAVCEQEVAALEVLVRAGADPNVRSGGGDTPLRICAESGYLAMAALLLFAGAAQTINDWGGISGYTALGLAALRLDLPMIKLLLAAGADPRAPDEDKRPAHYCMPPRADSDSQKWDEVFELLGGAKDRMPL